MKRLLYEISYDENDSKQRYVPEMIEMFVRANNHIEFSVTKLNENLDVLCMLFQNDNEDQQLTKTLFDSLRIQNLPFTLNITKIVDALDLEEKNKLTSESIESLRNQIDVIKETSSILLTRHDEAISLEGFRNLSSNTVKEDPILTENTISVESANNNEPVLDEPALPTDKLDPSELEQTYISPDLDISAKDMPSEIEFAIDNPDTNNDLEFVIEPNEDDIEKSMAISQELDLDLIKPNKMYSDDYETAFTFSEYLSPKGKIGLLAKVKGSMGYDVKAEKPLDELPFWTSAHGKDSKCPIEITPFDDYLKKYPEMQEVEKNNVFYWCDAYFNKYLEKKDPYSDIDDEYAYTFDSFIRAVLNRDLPCHEKSLANLNKIYKSRGINLD